VGSIPTARTWRGAGVRFEQVGTLHGDGTFEPLRPPINPIKVRRDGMSIGVGIKMASSSFPG
jgi:hypothetical protein